MMKKILLILMLTINISLSASSVLIKVPGMVCQMCVQGMQKGFQHVVFNARKDVKVDLEKKTVLLNLNKKISDKEIKKIVKDAGYNVSNITWKK